MSEEEVELRDLVAQKLENNGVLSRIRAELRASVFLALEEQESVVDVPEFANKNLRAFLNSDEGSLVASLVREFLEFFQLEFTLSVFDPETAQGKYYTYGGRSKLMKDLHIESLNGEKGPLLVQIVHRAFNQNGDSFSVKQNGNKPQSEDSIGTSSVVGNPTAQTNTQLDSDIPNNNTGERNSATPLQTEVETTKDTERKSVNATEPSKQVTDPNKVPRSKGIILPATIEEISPHSSLVSEAEHASHNSKDASKSKTVSPETPHNSQTLEQSSAHKPETQVAPNSDSIQNSSSKSACKQLQPQKTSKPNVEPITKAGTSTLSSLSNLPPLTGVNLPMKQAGGSFTGISQPKDMNQIKAMIDLGLESQDNYDEDFNSSVSVSAKEDLPNQGTDTEIEEELGSGVEDLPSSNSALDDLTADATLSNLTGVADYIEDVK